MTTTAEIARHAYRPIIGSKQCASCSLPLIDPVHSGMIDLRGIPLHDIGTKRSHPSATCPGCVAAKEHDNASNNDKRTRS